MDFDSNIHHNKETENPNDSTDIYPKMKFVWTSNEANNFGVLFNDIDLKSRHEKMKNIPENITLNPSQEIFFY